MLAMIIVSSLLLGGCLAVVGAGQQRGQGLGHWACGLGFSALGHLLLMLRGHVPDLASVVGANLCLSAALLAMTAGVYQFQGHRVPWRWLFVPTVVVGVAVWVHQDSFAARVMWVGFAMGVQSLWIVVVTLQGRRSAVGRGKWLVMGSMLLEALVLGVRALVPWFMGNETQDILQGSEVQTLTFFSTFGVMLVASIGFIFMLRDRTDATHRRMASVDPLTGVANRRSLIAALNRDVARALRTREPMALMMVDIDHFKRVNDRYGHLVGDEVLRNVVTTLSERVRAQDLVGRYGGEEFMVVLPDTDIHGAEQLARALCAAVQESRCHVPQADATGIAVTVSIGVFGGRLEPGDTWDTLIAAADRALYQAKENGRNRVEVAQMARRPAVVADGQSPHETLPPSVY